MNLVERSRRYLQADGDEFVQLGKDLSVQGLARQRGRELDSRAENPLFPLWLLG